MQTLISAENTWMLFAILVVIAAVSIRLEQRFLWAAKVSACVLCLVFAMALANIRVIPADAPAYDFVWTYLVPLAIPFLLSSVTSVVTELGAAQQFCQTIIGETPHRWLKSTAIDPK